MEGELTKKSIRQSNSINALHGRILCKIWIDKEENRHIHRLAGIQLLLLKAEALNLAEVRRNLARGHAVRGNADNVSRTLVGGRVKGKSRFAGQDADFALLRRELPGKHVRHGAVEGYA